MPNDNVVIVGHNKKIGYVYFIRELLIGKLREFFGDRCLINCVGICMEALCSPRMTEPTGNIVICLKALYTLFEGDEPRKILMENKSLAIELCNVLHR